MKKYLIVGLLISMNTTAESQYDDYLTSLDYAQIEDVKAVQSKDKTWCFEVQIKHNDQGWNHYANGWQVYDLEGDIISGIIIGHPHDKKQPFIRRHCNIKIKPDVPKVVVKTRCNVHGFGGRAIVLDMEKTKGDGYTITHYKK